MSSSCFCYVILTIDWHTSRSNQPQSGQRDFDVYALNSKLLARALYSMPFSINTNTTNNHYISNLSQG